MMGKMFCTKCKNCKEFYKPKIYIMDNSLPLSSKCGSEDEKLFKEEEWIEMLEILRLINYM